VWQGFCFKAILDWTWLYPYRAEAICMRYWRLLEVFSVERQEKCSPIFKTWGQTRKKTQYSRWGTRNAWKPPYKAPKCLFSRSKYYNSANTLFRACYMIIILVYSKHLDRHLIIGDSLYTGTDFWRNWVVEVVARVNRVDFEPFVLVDKAQF
jgi:hypothetical protein